MDSASCLSQNNHLNNFQKFTATLDKKMDSDGPAKYVQSFLIIRLDFPAEFVEMVFFIAAKPYEIMVKQEKSKKKKNKNKAQTSDFFLKFFIITCKSYLTFFPIKKPNIFIFYFCWFFFYTIINFTPTHKYFRIWFLLLRKLIDVIKGTEWDWQGGLE